MKTTLIKNLHEITLQDVISLIKSSIPDEYDKMIVDSEEIVQRTNFFYLDYSAKSISRTPYILRFPMFGNVKDNFVEFEGGMEKHGDKKIFMSTALMDTLERHHGIKSDLDINATKNDFEYPFEEYNNIFSDNQNPYFIPSRTFRNSCKTCHGKKYVTCDDPNCQGRHEWTCMHCSGSGKMLCPDCGGSKTVECPVCHGTNRVACINCNSKGKMDSSDVSKNTDMSGESSCPVCNGHGFTECNNCRNEKLKCQTCKGDGKVPCKKCEGVSKVTCTKCYSDKDRYGMIECPQCRATGEVGQISYFSTRVNHSHLNDIFYENNVIEGIDLERVRTFADKGGVQEKIRQNYNMHNLKKYDESIVNFLYEIHKKFNLSVTGYHNRIVEEELYFQAIPCVQIKYTHMITGKEHLLTILNFFENHDIVFDKTSEEVGSKRDSAKQISNFFGKLFQTKIYKDKEDKKKEIRLLITMAKVDGVIEEDEKIVLVRNISGIDEFTSDEKKEIFRFLNSKGPYNIVPEDVAFYSPDKLKEVLLKLEVMASSGKSPKGLEKELLNRVKGFIKQQV